MKRRNVLGVREARARFSQLLEDAHVKGEKYLIERAGRPYAVLLGAEQYEQMQGELATLQEERSPEARQRLKRAKSDIENGRLTPHEELMERLARRG